MSGLVDLPKSKWVTGGDNKILNQDFIDIEQGILEIAQSRKAPTFTWVDNTSLRVPATADSPTYSFMMGLPSIINNGWVIGSSDKGLRYNTTNVDFDFDVSSTLWGTEKSSQWYALYTIATANQVSFSLKAMPIMRVYTYSSRQINLRNLSSSSTGIGYGFTTDELAGYTIYFLSGSFAGYKRTIINNNNNNTTGGTITYSSSESILPLTNGDWFIILPSTNFRWIGNFYNNSSSNIDEFYKGADNGIYWSSTKILTINSYTWAEAISYIDPMAKQIYVDGSYGSGSTNPYMYTTRYWNCGIQTDYGDYIINKLYDTTGATNSYYGKEPKFIEISFCRYRSTAIIGTPTLYWGCAVVCYKYPEGYLR